MSALFRSLLACLALMLAGCAATVQRPAGADSSPLATASTKPTAVTLLITGNPEMQKSPDWQAFRGEWRGAFAAAALAAGITPGYAETEPAAQPAGTVLVRVHVNDYRYLSSGARIGLGILTGNAYVDADAEFVELPARRSLGKRKYATTSTAWQGIFSAMTDKQLRALSDAMIEDLSRR